eukprot:scaffold25262_cov17-Prasinocladus_malaysianus.AAC.1
MAQRNKMSNIVFDLEISYQIQNKSQVLATAIRHAQTSCAGRYIEICHILTISTDGSPCRSTRQSLPARLSYFTTGHPLDEGTL